MEDCAMARRVVYEMKLEKPFFRPVMVDADFPKGWIRTPSKAVEVVNEAYKKKKNTEKISFEVSSAAKTELGNKLSAFNLKDNQGRLLECVFQSSKKFKDGGPYLDLLDTTPSKAKKDPRLKNSGALVAFVKDGVEYPLFPQTAFYDFIYISALMANPDLWDEIDNYDAFSDVWFNPDKSLNCQAEAMAMFRGLKESNHLDEAMKSYDDFVSTVFFCK